jgi:hypothetical protein
MINIVSLFSKSTTHLCAKCQASNDAGKYTDLKKLEEVIGLWEAQAKDTERLIRRLPAMPDVPSQLAPFAATPLTIFKAIQINLAELKARRMILITQQGSDERLNHELTQAIAAEDFERAAELRDLLKKKEEPEKAD